MKGRKMISAVNSYNPVIQTKPIQFKGEQIQAEPTKKESMSTTTKALLGLGALAAIVAGGLLIKKRVDTNEVKDIIARAHKPSVDDLLKSAIDIKKFDEEAILEILKKCTKDIKTGDALVMLPACEYKGLSKISGVDYAVLPANSFITYIKRGNEMVGSEILVKCSNFEGKTGNRILAAINKNKTYIKLLKVTE